MTNGWSSRVVDPEAVAVVIFWTSTSHTFDEIVRPFDLPLLPAVYSPKWWSKSHATLSIHQTIHGQLACPDFTTARHPDTP